MLWVCSFQNRREYSQDNGKGGIYLDTVDEGKHTAGLLKRLLPVTPLFP